MKVYYMITFHNDLIIGTNRAKVLKQAKQWEKEGASFEDGLQVETFATNLRGIGDAINFGIQLAGGEPGDLEWLMP
jgi:hypothetical protein